MQAYASPTATSVIIYGPAKWAKGHVIINRRKWVGLRKDAYLNSLYKELDTFLVRTGR